MGIGTYKLVKSTITKDYNPRPNELNFVEVLCELNEEINKKLVDLDVYNIESNTNLDNPKIGFYLKDNDDDQHKIVLKIIQKPDIIT